MRFIPDKCPECGQSPYATCDLVPGNALISADEDGEFEYDGETKMCWDGQYSETDDEGRVHMICYEGHMWFAEQERAPGH